MTLPNMAVLAQRLGADERALDLYARIGANESMQPAEEAQLLVNRGALFRRRNSSSINARERSDEGASRY